MTVWITAQASVIGLSHTKSGAPCQDASIVRTSRDGQWLVVVVSDGAGTAAKAEIGSKLVSEFFANELLKLVEELQKRAPGHWINDFVISKVLETREALRNLAKSDDIRDYNCTLVACLQGPSGGFSIHIGDGSILGGLSNKKLFSSERPEFLSPPENGEYSNETYFITEGDWVKHLRVMPMPKLDWLICCTDGGGDLALVADKEPKNGFLKPVVSAVFDENDLQKRNAILRAFLEDPQADKATSDDKTIVFAVKDGCQNSISNVFVVNETFAPNSLQISQASTPPIKAHSNASEQGTTAAKSVFSKNKTSRSSSKKKSRTLFWLLCTLVLALLALISALQFESFTNPVKSKVTKFWNSSQTETEQNKNPTLSQTYEKIEAPKDETKPLLLNKSEEKPAENKIDKSVISQ
jgi:hypothetical protein